MAEKLNLSPDAQDAAGGEENGVEKTSKLEEKIDEFRNSLLESISHYQNGPGYFSVDIEKLLTGKLQEVLEDFDRIMER